MDKILFGPAYYDGNPNHPDPITEIAYPADPLDTKLIKLADRAVVYLKYDRYLAENGFAGN